LALFLNFKIVVMKKFFAIFSILTVVLLSWCNFLTSAREYNDTLITYQEKVVDQYDLFLNIVSNGMYDEIVASRTVFIATLDAVNQDVLVMSDYKWNISFRDAILAYISSMKSITEVEIKEFIDLLWLDGSEITEDQQQRYSELIDIIDAKVVASEGALTVAQDFFATEYNLVLE